MREIISGLWVKNTAVGLVVYLFCLSFFFYQNHFFRFPSHLHAWTQSDRYALAVGYAENSLNPFLPSTPNLYPKYPPEEGLTAFTGITSAALPLPEWLAGTAMRISGSLHPAWLRGIVLLSGLTGLFLLFKLSRELLTPFPLSFLLVTAAFSSPVFTYYLNGFIPGIPALALSIAGFYAYYRFLKSDRPGFFALSMTLFLLAAMIRPPFLMPMLAVVVTQLLLGDRPAKQLRIWLLAMVNILVFGIFMVYDNHLQNVYGSQFNNSLLAAGSLADWFELLSKAWNNWKMSYLTSGHVVLLLTAAGLFFVYRKALLSGIYKRLMLVIMLTFGAALLYSFAMAEQFPNHDYYFLDSFYLPLVWFIMLVLSRVRVEHRFQLIPLWFGALVFCGFMLHATAQEQQSRYITHSWDRTETSRINYEGHAAWLDKLGVPADARILVLDAYTSNVPLLLMNRKGFTVIETSAENLEAALDLPFDYLSIQNRSLPADILLNLPDLSASLELVANNGRTGLYRRTLPQKNLDWISLLMAPGQATKRQITSESQCVPSNQAFVALADTLINSNADQLQAVIFESGASETAKVKGGLSFVVDAKGPGGFYFYDSFPLEDFFLKAKDSINLRVFQNLPVEIPDSTRLKIYLWNKAGNEFCLRNTTVLFTKYSSNI